MIRAKSFYKHSQYLIISNDWHGELQIFRLGRGCYQQLSVESRHFTSCSDVIAVIVYLVRPNVTWLARIWKMTEYLFNQLYPFGSCWENFRKIETREDTLCTLLRFWITHLKSLSQYQLRTGTRRPFVPSIGGWFRWRQISRCLAGFRVVLGRKIRLYSSIVVLSDVASDVILAADIILIQMCFNLKVEWFRTFLQYSQLSLWCKNYGRRKTQRCFHCTEPIRLVLTTWAGALSIVSASTWRKPGIKCSDVILVTYLV